MYYLYTNENNSISIHHFNSDEDRIEYIKEKGCTQFVITNTPKDNYFLQAFEWDESTNNIKVNIEKAKEIRLNYFRLIRSMIFPKLDLLYLKSLENSDTEAQQKIISDKVYLRDISNIEMPNTERELINFIPDRLIALYNA